MNISTRKPPIWWDYTKHNCRKYPCLRRIELRTIYVNARLQFWSWRHAFGTPRSHENRASKASPSMVSGLDDGPSRRLA